MSRTFGVEVECGHPDGWEGVGRLFRASDCSREWSISSDGSGVEARTPILSGASGFKELKKGMNLIRSTGGYVTRRDGLHVHHGAPELRDKALAVRLIKSWVANTPVIEQFAAQHRCGINAYNPPWGAGHVRQLETARADSRYSTGWQPCGPRGAINLLSLENHGTVELRLFEGTLDYDIADAWVRFGQRFIDNVLKQRKRVLAPAKEPSELLKRVKLNKTASKRLLAKAGGGYTDLTFQSF